MRVRDINDFGPEHAYQTQNLLALDARTSGNGDECHLSFDVWTSGYILNLTDSCQSLALFDYLLNSAVFTSSNYRHSRPVRVQCLTNRDRLDVEPARAEQTNYAG